MRNILFIFTILLSYSYVYASDLSLSKAEEALNNPQARNVNNYDTTNIRNNINNWINNADSNLNAVMGDKNKDLYTIGTNKPVAINKSCSVSQKKIAELNISDGKNISINLNILSTNYAVRVNNITGICDNRFTVCDEEENKRLCSMIYNYTNYANEDREINGNDTEKELIKSHACYSVNKCMSWTFSLKDNNIILNNAAGTNCTNFKDTGITVSEKEALINQVKFVLSDLSVNGLSDVISGELNSNTEYYELSNLCDNYSYGSNKTDIKDLMDIYNNPLSDADKNTVIETERNNKDSVLSQIEKSQDNYTLNKDITNKVNQGIDDIGIIADNIKVEKVCYNPICTIDITDEEIRTKSDGTQVKEKISKRIFKDCTASSYVEKNNIKETVYTCPVNNTTEKAVAQDNGDICTCDNKHQQAANLQKVLIATSMAEAIRNSACGKNDEEDNKTLNNITDRRNECYGKTGDAYERCMEQPFLDN